MIEVSRACRPVKGKGHDRALIARVTGWEDAYIVAVADGLTGENGGEAAQWTVEALERIASEHHPEKLSARSIFAKLSRRLETAVEPGGPNSHTTLTCGMVSPVDSGRTSDLRFDFFAVGDSPVWKVFPSKSKELEFQGFIVYSGPLPGEQGRVYSTLNLRGGSIDGVVYFGSVDVEPGEVLILVSDGIPDARFFWDDQDPKRNRTSPKLALRLLDPAPLGDKTLATLITAYDENHLLIDDDASLVVIRVASDRSTTTSASGSLSGAGDLEHSATIIEPATELKESEKTNRGEPIIKENDAFSTSSGSTLPADPSVNATTHDLARDAVAELTLVGPVSPEAEFKPEAGEMCSQSPDSQTEPTALLRASTSAGEDDLPEMRHDGANSRSEDPQDGEISSDENPNRSVTG